ncbi:MAG: 1-deoxy-D-xylulose-5-phosphate synthase N-terminal domain-containing protein [Candidatus Ratteibacteria bacterium]
MKFSAEQKSLRRRILELSYAKNRAHLGSCLSAVDIIYAIYKTKKDDERFVLSNGHAGTALYVVLEKCGLVPYPIIDNLHIHPDRDSKIGIDVSTGSLGQGLPVALGMALADRRKNVYCLVSDGECTEGSIWEALRVGFEQKLSNLKIVINANGWGAYAPISLSLVLRRVNGFGYKAKVASGHNINKLSRLLASRSGGRPLLVFARTTVDQFAFLKGLDAHYYVMNKKDYESAKDILK